MAMVLDAFASYLGNLLAQMAKDEVGMLLGVSDEIKKMEAMLHDIENFLADAERRRITDRSVAGWVRELKDVMYDASDILDICQLKAEERRASMDDTGSGCCNSLLFCLRDPRFAHRIGTQMKALNQKLQDISERSAQFRFINLGSYEDHRGMAASSRDVRRETGPVFIQEDIVGEKIEQDTSMLVEMLTKEEEATRRMSSGNTMVIAIVGTGGIGKTTLAKKIFNDEVIHGKFDKKVWLSVTEDFKEIDLLKNVITGLGSNHIAHLGDNKAQLEQALVSAVNQKKFLFVMDDTWSDKVWNELLRAPLIRASARGSRILVTTRDEGVARQMMAIYFHHVNKLGSDWVQKMLESYSRNRLQKLTIWGCPKLKELEGVEALRSIELQDYEMETLPGYLQDARQVTKLEIHCSLKLLKSISMRGVGSEWDKINHVQQLKAYALEGDDERRWYFLYTREPYNVFFDTNIDSTSI